MSLHFNFEHYSTVLSNNILEYFVSVNKSENIKELKPLVMGIQGDWGSGKTTLLQAIHDKVDEQKGETRVIPVLFNAWRFEKEEHLIIPLLHSLRYKILEILENKEDSFSDNAEKVAGELLKVLRGFEFEIDLKFAKFKYAPKETIEAMEKEDNPLEEYVSIYFNITKKIEKLGKENDIRLVFLVDDLDRCLPENSIRMLESIKLFLDIPYCVSVLAIDKEIVELGIEHRYKEYGSEDNRPITGSEYLEKIITHPFSLPTLCDESVNDFLASYKLDEDIQKLFLEIVPFNPRKIIRLIDKYNLEHTLFPTKNEKVIVAEAIIEIFLPKLHRELMRDTTTKLDLQRGYNSSLQTGNKIYTYNFQKEILTQLLLDNEHSRVTLKINNLLKNLFIE